MSRPLYTPERGHLDLADAGVVYQDPQDIISGDPWVDQTDAVQTAYGMAQDVGGSILVSGVVASRPIDNSGNIPTIGRGVGENWYTSPSVLACYGDVDTAKAPFLAHGTSGAVILKDIYLKGPLGNPPVTGEFGNVMAYGFSAPTRAHIQGVKAKGFAVGASSNNDHQLWRDCDLGDNEIASIDFIDRYGVVGVGDMQFDHCFLTANGIASIIIADNAVLANAQFVGNGHIGLSPVGILRYEADPASNDPVGQALVGCAFHGWSFEYIRYAAMWDRGRNFANWTNILWAPGTAGYGMMAGDYTIDGWPDPDWPDPDSLAMFHLGDTVEGWRWVGDVPTLDGRVTLSAESFVFDVEVASLGVGDFHAATANLFEVRKAFADNGVEFGGITLGTHGRYCGGSVSTVRTAQTTVQRGDVLMETQLNHVAPFDGTRPPVGVSVADYAQGEPAIYTSQNDEATVGIRNTSGGAMVRNDWVKPDPASAGGCVKTTVISEAIGYVTATGIADGAWGQTHIQL